MSKPTPREVFGPNVQRPLEFINAMPDGGVWSIEETQLQRLSAGAPLMFNAVHSANRLDGRNDDAVAIREIEIRGVLLKNWNTSAIAREIRHAANADDVDAILLRIDSPGGHTAGIADAGREVREAASRKPVIAFAEDATFSAAYWIASQARKIYANAKTAMVGSIGAYFAIYDWSGYAGQAGIKPVVVKAGKYKGAGFEGTEITAEQKAEWQELINTVQSQFNAAVSEGRKIPMARVEELADGRVHMAEDAVTLGLIDGIQTLDETLAQLAVEVRTKRNSNMRTPAMAETTSAANMADITPRPATLAELDSVCPGANGDFLVAQQRLGATAVQAQTAWQAELRKQAETAAEQHAKEMEALRAENEQLKAAAQRPGVKPLVDGGSAEEVTTSGDPIAEFDAKVQAQVESGMTKRAAIRHAAVNHPELHEAYLAAQPLYRPKRGRARQTA